MDDGTGEPSNVTWPALVLWCEVWYRFPSQPQATAEDRRPAITSLPGSLSHRTCPSGTLGDSVDV